MTKPPTSLKGQLLWREFFYCVGSHTNHFDRMVSCSCLGAQPFRGCCRSIGRGTSRLLQCRQ